jgi:predicted aminopeptidase
LKVNRATALRKLLCFCALLLLVVLFSGCHTFRFYGQAIQGQYQILADQENIDELLKSPQTPAELKARFELIGALRSFANAHLHLRVDSHYQKYVDLRRPYVVWNVEAASELSMQPKTWWYPFVGSLDYRGYFTKNGATNYAAYLRSQGLDVSVGGVQAYSTLGWFKDPVLNTFVFESDAELAELLFHELGHQQAFARGDTEFNEAFATSVGQEGTRRWLRSRGHEAELAAYLTNLQRNDQFVHLVLRTRSRLEALYGDERDETGKIRPNPKPSRLQNEQIRKEKQLIINDLKREYTMLKSTWNGDSQYDGWFERELNNSHFNAIAAYYDLVPGFEQLLADNGGDLQKFYEAAKRLAKAPRTERHAALRLLAQRARPGLNPQNGLASAGATAPKPNGQPVREDRSQAAAAREIQTN